MVENDDKPSARFYHAVIYASGKRQYSYFLSLCVSSSLTYHILFLSVRIVSGQLMHAKSTHHTAVSTPRCLYKSLLGYGIWKGILSARKFTVSYCTSFSSFFIRKVKDGETSSGRWENSYLLFIRLSHYLIDLCVLRTVRETNFGIFGKKRNWVRRCEKELG